MGIANDVNFELELSRFVSGSHLYDDSIITLPMQVENSVFFKERIGGSGNTSITKALSRVESKYDLILKMDIEGSEWDALEGIQYKDLDRFRQIVVEFHWLERILIDENFTQVVSVLERLNESHFILNSHPNNHGDVYHIESISLPSVIEVSYLRRRDYRFVSYCPASQEIIENLNSPCNSDFPDIYLPGVKIPSKLNLFTKNVGTYSRFQLDALVKERDALVKERDALVKERDTLVKSKIWRFFEPYRFFRRFAASLFTK
jgi:hypothetical protein